MRAGVAVAVVLAGMLISSAAAHAANFSGQSDQGLRARVQTNPEGEVRRFSIRWKTENCSRAGWFLKPTRTSTVPPLDRSRPGSFVDRGHYGVEYRDARVRYEVAARGRRTRSDRWTGTFAARVLVKFDGGGEMTCKLRRIDWAAKL